MGGATPNRRTGRRGVGEDRDPVEGAVRVIRGGAAGLVREWTTDACRATAVVMADSFSTECAFPAASSTSRRTGIPARGDHTWSVIVASVPVTETASFASSTFVEWVTPVQPSTASDHVAAVGGVHLDRGVLNPSRACQVVAHGAVIEVDER